MLSFWHRAPWTARDILRTLHLSALQYVHNCACSAAGLELHDATLQQPLFPAQPGSVAPFQHHVFVREKSDADSGADACSAWPPVVERYGLMHFFHESELVFAVFIPSALSIQGTGPLKSLRFRSPKPPAYRRWAILHQSKKGTLPQCCARLLKCLHGCILVV